PASARTRSSSVTNSSKRSQHRQYRTISYHSQVDESLFGSARAYPSRAPKTAPDGSHGKRLGRLRGDPVSRRPQDNREKVQVIMMDLVRNLTVPAENSLGPPVVLNNRYFAGIKQRAQVSTEEERKAMEEEYRKRKEEVMKQRIERHARLKRLDLQREADEKHGQQDLEAKLHAETLRAKANQKLEEEEDKIKHLNELILEVQCHAIRDAQLEEKKQMREELASEEQRLDEIMEAERKNAIKVQEEIDSRRKQMRRQGAEMLREQIVQSEERRMRQEELKEVEVAAARKLGEEVEREKQREVERRKEKQVALREELLQACQRMAEEKLERQQQEKEEEKHVLEFYKEKEEREAQLEAQQEAARVKKEREVARVRRQQERVLDERAERDGVRARRAMEEAEREWRRKEAEMERRRAETQAELREARRRQHEEKQRRIVEQVCRDKEAFEMTLRIQKELSAKEKEEDKMAKEKTSKYCEELRKQIMDNEQQRIKEKQEFFEESKRFQEQDNLYRQRLSAIKDRKLQQMRNAGIPDRYLGHVTKVAQRMMKV
ncbi:cilia- and flagella-associated protein 45-like, partial [Argonauta hians]